ncbi:MAG: uracil-DNA glycosylase [Gammaproteobacteria bacterium]|nr:uracil-DNA glycosylase [Gammaproteobacteria bacterium]
MFNDAPLAHYINHPQQRFRIDFSPVFYRGRLDGTARLLIVGQDPSTDEILAQRAFVGSSGQRLQGLLHKLGITRSYIILNTFLYGINGQFDNTMKKITQEDAILNYRNALFDQVVAANNIEAVITIGAGARDAVERWPEHQQHAVYNLIHPSAPENMVLPDWNKHLPDLLNSISPDDDGVVDATPYGVQYTAGDEKKIPRYDLPFGIPVWHGTNGTRSIRDGADKIIWNAVTPAA